MWQEVVGGDHHFISTCLSLCLFLEVELAELISFAFSSHSTSGLMKGSLLSEFVRKAVLSVLFEEVYSGASSLHDPMIPLGRDLYDQTLVTDMSHGVFLLVDLILMDF